MMDDGTAGTSAPEVSTFSWSNPYVPGLVPAPFHDTPHTPQSAQSLSTAHPTG